MTTIVNNPRPVSSNNGIGFFLGALLLLLAVIAFIFYGLPYMRSISSVATAPQINVPDHVNVNIQHSTNSK